MPTGRRYKEEVEGDVADNAWKGKFVYVLYYYNNDKWVSIATDNNEREKGI